MMNQNNKTKEIHLRVSVEENERLRNMAKVYPNLSSFILDACWHFDGEQHKKKLEYLDEKYRILLSLKNDLSHLSGNLNQLVQYTNRCIYMGVYLNNTSQEVLRIESELLDCLSEYSNKIKKLEKELKQTIKKL